MEELNKKRIKIDLELKEIGGLRLELAKREISLNEDMMMCNFHLIELMEDSLK